MKIKLNFTAGGGRKFQIPRPKFQVKSSKFQIPILFLLFFNVLFPLIKGGTGVVLAQGGQKWSLGLNAASGNAAIGTSNLFPFVIKTNSTEWMRVTRTGRVGIGTTTPSEKLHVAGTARMLNAKVDNLMQALSVSANSASFSTVIVTGQITGGSLIVNGNTTISGQLTTSSLLVSGNS